MLRGMRRYGVLGGIQHHHPRRWGLNPHRHQRQSLAGDGVTWNEDDGRMGMGFPMAASLMTLPEYTFTRRKPLLNDGDDNWRVMFLTSGTLDPVLDGNPTVD